MTQKTEPERFTCPGLEEGGRVAIQLTDGTLIEGASTTASCTTSRASRRRRPTPSIRCSPFVIPPT